MKYIWNWKSFIFCESLEVGGLRSALIVHSVDLIGKAHTHVDNIEKKKEKIGIFLYFLWNFEGWGLEFSTRIAHY